MRSLTILAAMTCLGTAGCSPPQEAAPAVPAPATAPEPDPAPPANPRPAAPTAAEADGETRKWSFGQDDERAYLVYAIPDSDDAGPALHCRPGSGTVGLFHWVEHRESEEVGAPPTAARLSLSSGTVARTYPATATGEELYGGSQVEARIGADDPVLAEFARTGRIAFEAFGESHAPPAAPVQDVRGLLAACARR